MVMIPDALRTVLSFLVVLGVLIFVHEMGHYLAARWRGVHVEAFSIGFGRSLASWRDRHGTVWKLAWLPLGGYVKLHGQEQPLDAPDEVRMGWVPGQTFYEKSVGSRAIIVAAGPVANFLLAILIFAALFAFAGRPVLTSVLGPIQPGSAAETAGLQQGDRVLAINDAPTALFEDIRRIVSASPGQALTLRVRRAGQELSLPVVAAVDESGGTRKGVLGVRNAPPELVPVNPAGALIGGVEQTWDVVVQTITGLGQIIRGTRTTEELSGPIGILQLSGQASKLGLAGLASFVAFLSVSLGLLNLFPIPILDGGHLVFYVFEWIRGRPLPPRVQEYGLRAGFAVLAGLFLFATWNDLTRWGLFRWVAGLVG